MRLLIITFMCRRLASILLLLSMTLPTAGRHRAVRSPGPPAPLILERSFAITDLAILDAFRFERVLAALAARSDVPGMTAEKLFRQWFDTQNPKPGLDASMPHCDDELTGGKPSLNGFAIACPADGGPLATAPFLPDELIPISITNRFDLANGTNCGQYRIAFAKRVSAPQIFHVIFEAALPNPDPSGDLAGCRPVAQFWADLSSVASMEERRARLERFFFDGIDGFAPAIHPDHYHVAPAGIRTVQLGSADLAHFFQYRLIHDGRLYFKPDVLENTPPGDLFDARSTTPRAVAFRTEFLKQVKTLSATDVNLYFMNIPTEFLVADPDPDLALDRLPHYAFTDSLSSAAGMAFRDAIAAEVQKAGSTLTPLEVVERAHTQTCGGCHFGGNRVGDGIVFPIVSVTFAHVSETVVVAGEGGPASRFQISPAMRNVFIPHRMQILRDFLATGKAPGHSN